MSTIDTHVQDVINNTRLAPDGMADLVLARVGQDLEQLPNVVDVIAHLRDALAATLPVYCAAALRADMRGEVGPHAQVPAGHQPITATLTVYGEV